MSILGQAQRFTEQLSDLSRTSDKMDFLRQSGKDCPEFKEVLFYALNPYKKFYLTKMLSSKYERPPEGTKTWDDVKWHLDRLSNRVITGKTAEEATAKLNKKLSVHEYKMLLKILNKDLRCGVGAVLVNKVWPGLIPEFGLMLCDPLQENHLGKLRKHRCYHQAKKNGDRCVVICRLDGTPEVYSRKGHLLHNYTEVAEALQTVTNSIRVSMVWDGEVIRGDFFKTRSTKKLAGNDVKDAKFYCFDCVQLEQWETGRTDRFSKRLSELRGISKQDIWEEQGCLVRVPTFLLKDEDKSMEYLEQLRDSYMDDLKEEGVIIRLDEPYNFKTRSSCFKFKRMDTMDCTLMEVLPGEEGKKHEHHAGSVMVELDNGQLCKAGLKLDDKERDELWKHRKEKVGMTVEIAYQEKTVNQQGEYKLQFPVFTGVFREDKS